MKKNYSSSQASSSKTLDLEGQSMVNALKMLMKERLIVTRLGFPDKAMELDREIEIIRKKANEEKKRTEDHEVDQRMQLLATSHRRKEQKLEYALFLETEELMERFAVEERHLLERQEAEFIKVRACLRVCPRFARGPRPVPRFSFLHTSHPAATRSDGGRDEPRGDGQAA
jgi:hypothetical protein